MPSENGDVIKNDRAPDHLTVRIQNGGQTLSCALYKSVFKTTLVRRVFVPFVEPCTVRNEDSRYEIREF